MRPSPDPLLTVTPTVVFLAVMFMDGDGGDDGDGEGAQDLEVVTRAQYERMNRGSDGGDDNSSMGGFGPAPSDDEDLLDLRDNPTPQRMA